MVAELACLAQITQIKGVDPFEEWADMFFFVRQETSLEVTPIWVFGTHACSGKVRLRFSL